MKLSLIALLLAAPVLLPAVGRAADHRPLNVLFIAVDDLRPELGCYGNPVIKTPNIDRLAASGTRFDRAYCQQAVCNPSRVALLTALRPDTTHVYDLPTHFRDKVPDALTLPQYFKQNGYYTIGVGKIFHTAHGNRDDPLSWSERRSFPGAPRTSAENRALVERLRKAAIKNGVPEAKAKAIQGRAWEAPDVPDLALSDGMFAENGVKLIDELKDRPFFIAVGFHNPHLPFVAPKKYWDLYQDSEITLARNPFPPKDAPAYAGHDSGELRAYYGVPATGPIPDDMARDLVHAYYGAVSYIDAGVGRLLDELDRLHLREHTVVILWGDHGWQLGEHSLWGKDTNYEIAARAPLIISVPGQQAVGKKSPALVEFVDVFPTLADVCGLPVPKQLEGTSFKPLLDHPGHSWKTAAFNLFPRHIPGVGDGMGRSIRTDRYRLVEWTVDNTPFREYELYDEKYDADENVNLAVLPEERARVQELADQLHRGWRAAGPSSR